MIGKLFASVPGQRPVKFAGQSQRLLDQRRATFCVVLVRTLTHHHGPRRALKKVSNILLPCPADQVTLPMAWDCTIFNRCWSFADRYGVLDLAEPVPFQAGVPRAADRAFC